jgi:hypothetical protein
MADQFIGSANVETFVALLVNIAVKFGGVSLCRVVVPLSSAPAAGAGAGAQAARPTFRLCGMETEKEKETCRAHADSTSRLGSVNAEVTKKPAAEDWAAQLATTPEVILSCLRGLRADTSIDDDRFVTP